MKNITLTPEHPSWDVYIKFHTGQYSPTERATAKAVLFPIHYGMTDTSLADAEVKRIRDKQWLARQGEVLNGSLRQ